MCLLWQKSCFQPFSKDGETAVEADRPPEPHITAVFDYWRDAGLGVRWNFRCFESFTKKKAQSSCKEQVKPPHSKSFLRLRVTPPLRTKPQKRDRCVEWSMFYASG